MRVQFGMVQAFQLINQWIDPYTGSTATVNNVTASSSLMGRRLKRWAALMMSSQTN